ncbi:MAG TPA: enoyl-CoA hydratase-related protein [Kofleriaceae bacterium]|jgi:enoyl-CoA hydratase/carnithine racemase|nr:enoyl-CoA hydratase-related protein [Kofleriaceae bacterium]
MTYIQVTTADRITTLRFDRADKKNAITIDMYAALEAGLEAAAVDANVRAVVITGSRECFTSGNDLGDFLRVAQGGGAVRGALGFLHAIATFEKPVVASVSGVAIGIGTTLLLHCDLVYAAPSAKFKTPFVDLALVPEAGSSVLLPALVGARRAAQLLLLGEQLDAATAASWGLINAVADDPDAAAYAAAARLAACAPSSLRATKALTRRATRDTVLEAMRIEGDAFGDRLRSGEALEALQAFQQRRAPDFSKF